MNRTSTEQNSDRSDADDDAIALTPQQRTFTDEQGRLTKYRQLVVGNSGMLNLLAYEMYQLLIAPLPGLLGLGVRALVMPHYLAKCGSSAAVGRNVTLRHPSRLHIGSRVIIDDDAVLDVRASANANSRIGISLGDRVTLGRQSLIIAKDAEICIGSGTNISSFCRIASDSKIHIGQSVLIAAYGYIGPGNHHFDDLNLPIMEQGMERRGGVVIGDNAWIGARATILDGVTVGSGAIVAAHSVVRENVPDNAIVAGTPAKILRYRK